MIFTLITAALTLALAGSLILAWRTWRDPDNWRLDPERGGIAFNHWKEFALTALICVASAVLLVFWIA